MVDAAAPSRTTLTHRLSVWLAAWLAVLAVDLLFNAGILAQRFIEGDPVLLAGSDAALRIPIAYAVWAAQVVALMWLLCRLGISTVIEGARYGGAAGLVAGGLSLVALWTIVRLDADLVMLWTAAATIEGAAAGAAIRYVGSHGVRGWAIMGPAILTTVLVAFVLQNLN